MNYFKKGLALLLVTGLTISSAQAGIKLEVDCNLVQPIVKGLTNTFDVLSKVRIPTISLANRENHTIKTVYKNIPDVAFGVFFMAASIGLAGCAYDYYQKDHKNDAFSSAIFSAFGATMAGLLLLFGPTKNALTVTEYYN